MLVSALLAGELSGGRVPQPTSMIMALHIWQYGAGTRVGSVQEGRSQGATQRTPEKQISSVAEAEARIRVAPDSNLGGREGSIPSGASQFWGGSSVRESASDRAGVWHTAYIRSAVG